MEAGVMTAKTHQGDEKEGNDVSMCADVEDPERLPLRAYNSSPK